MVENKREIPISDLEKILSAERVRINANRDSSPHALLGALSEVDNIAVLIEEEFGVSLTIGRDSERTRPPKPSETTSQEPLK